MQTKLETAFGATAGVIFLPGASGGAIGRRFDPIAKELVTAGYTTLRADLWGDGLGEKTIEGIHAEMDALVALLKKQKLRIAIVAKSIGGAFAITYHNPAVQALVLWSPAIGFGKENYAKLRTRRLSVVTHHSDLRIDDSLLSGIKIPVRIIHGGLDTVVPLANSQTLVTHLPHGDLYPIGDADHGFESERNQRALITATLSFLRKHVPP